MFKRNCKLNSKKDTDNLAKILAATAVKGAVFCLYGELGTGKTFFTQKFCNHLGIKEIVNSPSYMIMHEYKNSVPVFHLDLYRLKSEEEVLELGLEEIFETGITLIEWPRVAEFIIPRHSIKIFFSLKNQQRCAKLITPKSLDNLTGLGK